MTGRQGPPRFTRRLLTLLLPADLQASVPGDLEEVFRRDAARHGARHARRSSRYAVEQEDLEIWIVSREQLIAMKREAGRPIDQQDIDRIG